MRAWYDEVHNNRKMAILYVFETHSIWQTQSSLERYLVTELILYRYDILVFIRLQLCHNVGTSDISLHVRRIMITLAVAVDCQSSGSAVEIASDAAHLWQSYLWPNAE